MPEAKGITITADGKEVFVYEVLVNFSKIAESPKPEPAAASCFDFSGKVKVVVEREGVNKVTIRPLSRGIIPVISGNRITFTIDKPAKLTLEFNDDLHGVLHLFASAIEDNPPKEGDPGVRYFGPGIHKENIILQSDQTVYLAGGAVLRGNIRGDSVNNVRIMGRGMLNGGTIQLIRCSDIEVNGIHSFRPGIRGWMATSRGCNNIRFIDYKSIGCFNNSDGCNPVSCTNFVIRDCFFRQWDDVSATKGGDMGNVRNIEISDVIAWGDKAQIFEIGYETRCDTISNVYVHDCTVIHAMSRPVVSIHNSDHAYITDILYENITVEHGALNDYNPYLIDLWIGTSVWARDKERGRINGITIKNLTMLSGNFRACRIAGYDADHKVENVVIENLKINDKYVLYPEDARFNINEYTSNIKFLQTLLN
jgi:hypothetical protein